MATKPDFHEWRPHPWHGVACEVDKAQLANLPPIMVERLQHYFQTYKLR